MVLVSLRIISFFTNGNVWACFFFVSFFREKVKTILVKRMRSLRWMKGGFLFGERMKGGVRMDWTARPNNSGEGDVGGGE